MASAGVAAESGLPSSIRAARPPLLDVVGRETRPAVRGGYCDAVKRGVGAAPQATHPEADRLPTGAASAGSGQSCPPVTLQPMPPQPSTMSRTADDGGAAFFLLFFHSRHAVLLGTHARMDAMVWAGLSTTQTATRVVGACSLSQQTDIASQPKKKATAPRPDLAHHPSPPT